MDDIMITGENVAMEIIISDDDITETGPLTDEGIGADTASDVDTGIDTASDDSNVQESFDDDLNPFFPLSQVIC